MNEINKWLVQEDQEGNFIIYPIPMFPIKGYAVPEKEEAIRFTNRMYPIIGLGFGVLMLAGYFGDFYFAIAVISYFLSIIIINLNFVKNFPTSKRKYSWKYYADHMNEKKSVFFLCLGLVFMFLICWMIFYNHFYWGNDSAGMTLFALSMCIYVFFMYLLILFYRIKSVF